MGFPSVTELCRWSSAPASLELRSHYLCLSFHLSTVKAALFGDCLSEGGKQICSESGLHHSVLFCDLSAVVHCAFLYMHRVKLGSVLLLLMNAGKGRKNTQYLSSFSITSSTDYAKIAFQLSFSPFFQNKVTLTSVFILFLSVNQ